MVYIIYHLLFLFSGWADWFETMLSEGTWDGVAWVPVVQLPFPHPFLRRFSTWKGLKKCGTARSGNPEEPRADLPVGESLCKSANPIVKLAGGSVRPGQSTRWCSWPCCWPQWWLPQNELKHLCVPLLGFTHCGYQLGWVCTHCVHQPNHWFMEGLNETSWKI